MKFFSDSQLSYMQLEKPEAILEVERLLKINFSEQIFDEVLHTRHSYCLNKKKQVIALNLDASNVTEIIFLEKFKYLKGLYISENKIQDLSPISQLSKLQDLYLYENEIVDISALSSLINLNHLCLNFNNISNIEPLSSLINLIYLEAWDNQIEDIQPLTKLKNLIELDLLGNCITDIKPIEELYNLKEADFRNNFIKSVTLNKPISIRNIQLESNQISNFFFSKKMKNLSELNLSQNNIENLDNLKELVFLTNLSLNGNNILDFSPLKHLKSLETISLDYSKFNDFKLLSNCIELKKLFISDNKISNLIGIEKLIKLENLYLSKNNISDISLLQNLTNIQHLSLSQNNIFCINSLGKLSKLTFLDISVNSINDISNLNKCINISNLNVNANNIENYQVFRELTKLKSLSFGSSWNNWNGDLTEIQKIDLRFLFHTHNLKELSIYDVHVQDLSIIQTLKHLEKLTLNRCNLIDISLLDNLIHIKELGLEGNKINKITSIEKLIKLERLFLGNNNISVFNLIFVNNFPNLRDLRISNNPIENIPSEICNNSRVDALIRIKTYLTDLEKGKAPNNEAKVIFIGNGSVGKTQIARRLALGKDFVFDEEHNSTHAIVQLEKHFDCDFLTSGLDLTLWDFAGQDIYHATHRLFMQTKALFVLVWDYENENKEYHYNEGKTYKNQPLSYWLEYAKCFAPNNPILLVQNKLDAENTQKLLSDTENSYKKNYPIFQSIAVSAKENTGFILLENVIVKTFEQHENFKTELLKSLPATWVEVRARVRTLQIEGTKEIDYDTFEQYCKEVKIKNSTPSILQFFHDTSILFYHQVYFNKKIIINQSWAIEAIYMILDRKSNYFEILEHKKGNLNYADLCKIWKENDDEERKLFMDFMLSCELCFETTIKKAYERKPLANRSFAIPQLLPSQEPDEIEYQIKDKKLSEEKVISFSFLPEVFVHRFIVQAHQLADIRLIWQNGIFLEKENQFALVRANFEEKIIVIRYSNNAKRFLEKIIEKLDFIKNEGRIKAQYQNNEKDWEKENKNYWSPKYSNHNKMEQKKYLNQLIANAKDESQRDVFISYSTKDQEAKNKLVQFLEKEGISYWLDEINIDTIGESVELTIEEGIRNSKCTVMLVSENSLRSMWVSKEALFRLLQENFTQENTLLPVILDKKAFDMDFVFEVYDELKEILDKEENYRRKAKDRNLNTKLFDIKIDRLQRILPNITDIFRKICEGLSANLSDSTKYEKEMTKLLNTIKRK